MPCCAAGGFSNRQSRYHGGAFRQAPQLEPPLLQRGGGGRSKRRCATRAAASMLRSDAHRCGRQVEAGLYACPLLLRFSPLGAGARARACQAGLRVSHCKPQLFATSSFVSQCCSCFSVSFSPWRRPPRSAPFMHIQAAVRQAVRSHLHLQADAEEPQYGGFKDYDLDLAQLRFIRRLGRGASSASCWLVELSIWYRRVLLIP